MAEASKAKGKFRIAAKIGATRPAPMHAVVTPTREKSRRRNLLRAMRLSNHDAAP
ncbi:hypothetical protein [Methylopila sp. M107]|uniref:hypothetical protein n=1 Tax=Methylopila sp. M107 TaxID=1101190 RepID=UPI0003822A5E|nr:hypothetical protein [Methylopila sp. M107]